MGFGDECDLLVWIGVGEQDWGWPGREMFDWKKFIRQVGNCRDWHEFRF